MRRLLSTGFTLLLFVACQGPRHVVVDEGHARATPDDPVDAVAKRCARIASCAHPHDPPRYKDPAACVAATFEHAGPPDPTTTCLEAATSCGAITACLHPPGDPRAVALCTQDKATGALATLCDGNALVSCAADEPAESTRMPCASGAVCGKTVAAGGLVAYGCLSPDACPANVTRTRCLGADVVVACHDQIEERVACLPGTTCHVHQDEDGEESATCEGANEVACATVGAKSCRGSVLVTCEAHGHHAHETTVDCAPLGLACSDVLGQATCTAPGPSCSLGAARCEHGQLAFCAAGRTEHIACEDLGLGPCAADGRGPSALCGAR